MKRKINTLILIICFGFVACIHDDTVTSFRALNKVEIGDLELKYSVMLNDTLKIYPTISTTENNNSELSYLWYIHQTNAAPSKDTLSYEKDLNVKMLPKYVTPGLPYTLIFKVVDNVTGVYYRKEMAVEVTTLYTKGTLLLCKDEGNAEVNFLKYDDARTLLDNVYSLANDELVGTNPLNIYAMDPNPVKTYMKRIFIACNDENGGVYASPITFKTEKNFRNAFEKPLVENIVNPTFYTKHQRIEYIIMNGKLHKRATNMGADQWESPCVCLEGDPDYDLAPFIFDYVRAIFYDKKNSRLLVHDPYNKGAVRQLLSNETGRIFFDNNNVGENMELVACGAESGSIGSLWMLMRNVATSKLFLLKFKMVPDMATGQILFVSTANIELTADLAPNIYNALSFSTNYFVDDILMYATSDKVYSLRVASIKGGEVGVFESLQVDLGSNNMEITKFDFVKIDAAAPTENNPNATKISNQLRISVIDNNLSVKKGGVVFYEVNSEGGIHSTHLFTRTGFCDEVVDIDEKYN